jgi:hypothetical protein
MTDCDAVGAAAMAALPDKSDAPMMTQIDNEFMDCPLSNAGKRWHQTCRRMDDG